MTLPPPAQTDPMSTLPSRIKPAPPLLARVKPPLPRLARIIFAGADEVVDSCPTVPRTANFVRAGTRSRENRSTAPGRMR